MWRVRVSASLRPCGAAVVSDRRLDFPLRAAAYHTVRPPAFFATRGESIPTVATGAYTRLGVFAAHTQLLYTSESTWGTTI